MSRHLDLDELRARLLAIGFTTDDGPPPFDTLFIQPPWGGLPYRLRDITDEQLARWESGEEDEPVNQDEE